MTVFPPSFINASTWKSLLFYAPLAWERNPVYIPPAFLLPPPPFYLSSFSVGFWASKCLKLSLGWLVMAQSEGFFVWSSLFWPVLWSATNRTFGQDDDCSTSHLQSRLLDLGLLWLTGICQSMHDVQKLTSIQKRGYSLATIATIM